MQTVIGANIRITDPDDKVKAWVENNLVIDNPEYLQKLRMNRWLGRTPKTLKLYSVVDDTLVLPYGVLQELKGYLTTDVTTSFKPTPDVDYGGEEIPLYPYQADAVNGALLKHFGILQSPAGSGKTQMGIAMIKAHHKRALWITHTKDLLNQSIERAKRYIDHDKIGTITEGRADISGGVTFATIQTLSRMDLTDYRDYWDMIICDECHRITGTPTRMSQYYKVLNALAARCKYGLSATVHRSDGTIRATYALLGRVCYAVPEEAVADKVMQVTIRAIMECGQLTRDCLGTDGMLNYSKLINSLCENDQRNRDIVGMLRQERGHSCLILSDRVEHLYTMMGMLPEDMRQYACCITGDMTSKAEKRLRQEYVDEMRDGQRKYLFATYALAKEGLDIPCLDRLFLATPHRDYAVITQSIGRIARTAEGKGEPVCYDFVDGAVGYLYKSWKERYRIYMKNGCKYDG